MKNIKLALFVVVILTGVLAGTLIIKHQTPPTPAISGVAQNAPVDDLSTPLPRLSAAAETPIATLPLAAAEETPAPTIPPQPLEPVAPQTTTQKAQPAAPAAPRARKPKEPLRDPLAREALYYVGADPAAEQYWLDAINDPNLSAHERQDLIEDLNEQGLPDSKHPTIDDLPLIVSRIRLIEEVGEDAMDQVNAAAFQEAYKDLLKLADIAWSDGRP